MALTSVALATARTLLNDDNATMWTDAILLPKLQEAHRELQTQLWDMNSPVVREVSSAITVATPATSLGVSQPADLLAPTKLMETSVAGIAWVDMTEVNYLDPSLVAATTLIYWCWREEIITFVGASVSRDVKVFYRKLITIPVAAASAIGIAFGEMYLGARTAAFAAGSVGNKESYDALTQIANTNLDKVLKANRGRQTPMMTP